MSFFFCLFFLSFVLLILVPCVWHPNHDGRRKNVFHLTRGVHLCCTEPLPGYCQSLPVHSTDHRSCPGGLSSCYGPNWLPGPSCSKAEWRDSTDKSLLSSGSVLANLIGQFRVHLSLHFKARLSAKSLLWKSIFIHIEIGTNYHS